MFHPQSSLPNIFPPTQKSYGLKYSKVFYHNKNASSFMKQRNESVMKTNYFYHIWNSTHFRTNRRSIAFDKIIWVHSSFLNDAATTPQPIRAPAWPVVSESLCPPLPSSSGFAWITQPRPRMLFAPSRGIWLSVMSKMIWPLLLAFTFPRSPACL